MESVPETFDDVDNALIVGIMLRAVLALRVGAQSGDVIRRAQEEYRAALFVRSLRQLSVAVVSYDINCQHRRRP
ncbi:hypothetical protein NM688_g8545 [Phlebia brevispora]|uniref:Uncharacterized protein n=1 Tax=Phlebia brevispora TaxID=194682 RepID=A0ACC1RQ96_9APHY|nr:hypothetical protein NM688_g8545 [Phlebia brevispora]